MNATAGSELATSQVTCLCEAELSSRSTAAFAVTTAILFVTVALLYCKILRLDSQSLDLCTEARLHPFFCRAEALPLPARPQHLTQQCTPAVA